MPIVNRLGDQTGPAPPMHRTMVCTSVAGLCGAKTGSLGLLI